MEKQSNMLRASNTEQHFIYEGQPLLLIQFHLYSFWAKLYFFVFLVVWFILYCFCALGGLYWAVHFTSINIKRQVALHRFHQQVFYSGVILSDIMTGSIFFAQWRAMCQYALFHFCRLITWILHAAVIIAVKAVRREKPSNESPQGLHQSDVDDSDDCTVSSEDEAHDMISNKNDAFDEMESSWLVLLMQQYSHFFSFSDRDVREA